MLTLLFSSPLVFLLALAGLLVSISLHEAAHCFVTDALGDPTPRVRGRLTLNPKAHLDPLGTVLLVLTGFGWGKPAPYDPYNLKSPVRDSALIALAGPLTNLLLAVILSILNRWFSGNLLNLLTQYLIMINLSLALFNLLPVYPLDGGKIMRALLPKMASLEYEQLMERYGNAILLFMILPIFQGQSVVSQILDPLINLLANWLL